MIERHQRIAGDLCNNRGASDEVAQRIAVDNGLARHRQTRRVSSINQDQIREAREVRDGLFHGLEGRLKDVVGIDGFGGHNPNSHEGLLNNCVIGVASLAGAEALGIVDPDPKALALPACTEHPEALRQHDSRCHHRTGPGPSTRLIHPSNQAESDGLRKCLRRPEG